MTAVCRRVGTKEMMQPCLIDLHIISLVAGATLMRVVPSGLVHGLAGAFGADSNSSKCVAPRSLPGCLAAWLPGCLALVLVLVLQLVLLAAGGSGVGAGAAGSAAAALLLLHLLLQCYCFFCFLSAAADAGCLSVPSGVAIGDVDGDGRTEPVPTDTGLL